MKQMAQASLFCGAGGLDIGFECAGFNDDSEIEQVRINSNLNINLNEN